MIEQINALIQQPRFSAVGWNHQLGKKLVFQDPKACTYKPTTFHARFAANNHPTALEHDLLPSLPHTAFPLNQRPGPWVVSSLRAV